MVFVVCHVFAVGAWQAYIYSARINVLHSIILYRPQKIPRILSIVYWEKESTNRGSIVHHIYINTFTLSNCWATSLEAPSCVIAAIKSYFLGANIMHRFVGKRATSSFGFDIQCKHKQNIHTKKGEMHNGVYIGWANMCSPAIIIKQTSSFPM